MEIERKFLVKQIPSPLSSYPLHRIEQGYLCTKPVVRIRKEDDTYYLTYKGGGKMMREEYNLPLNREAYEHLIAKADGYRIRKTRYRIPLTEYLRETAPAKKAGVTQTGEETSWEETLVAELDLFTEPGELVMAEVEFPSEEAARSFVPPDWFGEEVTFSKEYHNSYMSRFGIGQNR